MKKCLLALTVSLSSFSIANAKDGTAIHVTETIPYNLVKHSMAEHAEFVVISYKSWLNLNRKQEKQVYNEILAVLSTPYPQLAKAANDEERQLMEANRIHSALQEKIKNLLNERQTTKYNTMENYPELLFAKGY